MFAFDVVCEAVVKLWVQTRAYDSDYLIVDLEIAFLSGTVQTETEVLQIHLNSWFAVLKLVVLKAVRCEVE